MTDEPTPDPKPSTPPINPSNVVTQGDQTPKPNEVPANPSNRETRSGDGPSGRKG